MLLSIPLDKSWDKSVHKLHMYVANQSKVLCKFTTLLAMPVVFYYAVNLIITYLHMVFQDILIINQRNKHIIVVWYNSYALIVTIHVTSWILMYHK